MTNAQIIRYHSTSITLLKLSDRVEFKVQHILSSLHTMHANRVISLLFGQEEKVQYEKLLDEDRLLRAVIRAELRWPSLKRLLAQAIIHVRNNDIYQVPAEAPDLVLIRLPSEWTFCAISPTPTGLACTCDSWPPVTAAGPGDGLYCADILAYLLALYLGHPLSPLSVALVQLWQVTLDELRLQMTSATFDLWLLGSAVVPEVSTPLSLTVAVRNQYAQWWLTHRLHPVITRTLSAVAGYSVQVHFVVMLHYAK